jgi:hypothetical protein
MRQFRKSRKRGLGFESLESRWMMAGNLQVAVDPWGDLGVSGDGASNAVEIRGTGVPGEVVITPKIEQGGQQMTTINDSTDPILLTGFTGTMRISLREGNDELYIKDLIVPGNAYIWGGQGQDTIRLGNWVAYGTFGTGDVSIGGTLRIDESAETSANDGDTIFLGRVTADQIFVYARFGNDYIEVYNATGNGPSIGPVVYLDGGENSDVLNVAYMTVKGDLQLYGDQITSGNDLISMITSAVYGKAYVDVWQGSNTVALNANNFYGVLEVYCDPTTNNITLTNSYCAQRVTISCLGGNDTIRVEGNVMSDVLRIIAGSGYDNVTVQSNQIVTLYLDAGGDSDVATVNYNVVWGRADLLGGNGYDLLYMSGNLFVGGFYEDFEVG